MGLLLMELILPLQFRTRLIRNDVAPVDRVERGVTAHTRCRLNSRGDFILKLECGWTSLKCSNAAGSCVRTVRASLRSMRLT
jgi:hypothetical protein